MDGTVASEGTAGEHSSPGLVDLAQTVLLALSVACLCYFGFYLLAPWIWSQNISYQPADITPWILACVDEHDGIEIYALYILMFVVVVATAVANAIMTGLAWQRARNIVMVLSAVISCGYCLSIGFIPPMNTISRTPPFIEMSGIIIAAAMFSLIALLHYLSRLSPGLVLAAVAILLAPACFIATESILWMDYTYIFAPALRLLNGAPLSDIYFQYDLLPSLLAALWMKLKLDLNTFQVLGQAAYYGAILGVFLLSRRLFRRKEFSLFLVAALVLVRIYASQWDAVFCFQVTPLRLDLWLLLMAVVYWRGSYHWSAGLVCGVLILLLKTFGIIYSLAYLQLLITVFAVSYLDRKRGDSLWNMAIAHGKRCLVPVLIIAVFAIASYFVFKNDEYGNYSGYYQKIGIGFIKIAGNSFYWYVPPVFAIAIILLFRLRKYISPTYMTTGLLLTYCAIGNSIYFFGRSHEHNIINISIVLLFLFFMVLDLVERLLNVTAEKDQRTAFLRQHCVTCVAIALIAVIVVSYSRNITRKVSAQVQNAGRLQLIYPSKFDHASALRGYIDSLKALTGNSNKVYVMGNSDFALYYYGGYAPVGYCNPFPTWIFNKDLIRFVQGLIDNGYYLVCGPGQRYLLPHLRYNFETALAGTTVIATRPAGLVAPGQ